MSDKGNASMLEEADASSGPMPESTDAPRRRYLFGHQGSVLMHAISVAGSIGFLLFGYDQGVLGVSTDSREFHIIAKLTASRVSTRRPISCISLAIPRQVFWAPSMPSMRLAASAALLQFSFSEICSAGGSVSTLVLH